MILLGKHILSDNKDQEKHKVAIMKKVIKLDKEGSMGNPRFLLKYDNTQNTEEIVS